MERNLPADLPPLIDFEASSLSDCSNPISVAILLKGKIHYWIIRPEPDWIDWSYESQGIHGLSKSYIESNGLPVAEVYEKIIKLMEGFDFIYTDNPPWDSMWFSRMGVSPFKFKDVRDLLKPEQVETFCGVRKEIFHEKKLTAHRADHDVIGLGFTLDRLNGKN